MAALRFLSTLRRYGIDGVLRRRGSVVVGFSGGPDSSCLLRLLNDWCGKNSVRLAAAHVNHGIRGEEADRDEAFCRAVCRELDVPLYVKRADVPVLAAERGESLETAARAVRYAFFDEVSEDFAGSPEAAAVATAHNADDHLETVLLHLFRGSGLKGLGGIDPVRDGRFVRPLIADSSAAIRAWCATEGVPAVTDRTNLLPNCTRNELRLNVLPALAAVFPDAASAALRMSDLARRDEDCLDALARELLPEEGCVLPRRTFAEAHPAVSSRLARMMAERAGGRVPEAGQVEEILRLAGETDPHTVPLPGGIECTLADGSVRFGAPEKDPEPPPVFLWPRDGSRYENPLCVLRIASDAEKDPLPADSHGDDTGRAEKFNKLSISVSLSFDKIIGALRIRTRQPGDTLRQGGMTRRVSALFSDRKLPRRVRQLLPVAEDEEGIVWIPGFPPRDGLAPRTGESTLSLVCQFRERIQFNPTEDFSP